MKTDRYFKVIDKDHHLFGQTFKEHGNEWSTEHRLYLNVSKDSASCFNPDQVEEIVQTEVTAKRVFESGASRNSDQGKLDFEGFLCPLVLKRYAEYMHKCRKMEDGTLRASDNWQNGIPRTEYMKSLYRHFFDTWSTHRGYPTKEDQFENLCGVIFNSMGYLHELLKEEQQQHD